MECLKEEQQRVCDDDEGTAAECVRQGRALGATGRPVFTFHFRPLGPSVVSLSFVLSLALSLPSSAGIPVVLSARLLFFVFTLARLSSSATTATDNDDDEDDDDTKRRQLTD